MKTSIIIAILAMAFPAFGLSITPDSTRSNDNDITVFFTITDGENQYGFHADIPKSVNINDYLEANKERYLALILRKQYRGAEPEDRSLEAMRTWIANGAENTKTVIVDEKETVVKTVIAKKEWVSTHPAPSEIEELEARIAALEAR